MLLAMAVGGPESRHFATDGWRGSSTKKEEIQ
jgi:hypothetical protein